MSFCREYAAVLPLRMIHLRKNNPNVWERVSGLMDHLDRVSQLPHVLLEHFMPRRGRTNHLSVRTLYTVPKVVFILFQMSEEDQTMWRWVTSEFLRKSCGLEASVTDGDILRMVGILNTNGVSQGPMRGHGLYPTFSYISHR